MPEFPDTTSPITPREQGDEEGKEGSQNGM